MRPPLLGRRYRRATCAGRAVAKCIDGHVHPLPALALGSIVAHSGTAPPCRAQAAAVDDGRRWFLGAPGGKRRKALKFCASVSYIPVPPSAVSADT
jgi:hypothetical protein